MGLGTRYERETLPSKNGIQVGDDSQFSTYPKLPKAP